MTRINCIDVYDLSIPHLNGEYLEITRVFTLTKKRLVNGEYYSNRFRDIPNEYCLGEGHVKFFYDKCLFVLKRYVQLYKRRKFSLKHDLDDALFLSVVKDVQANIPLPLMGDWEPSLTDKQLNLTRLIEKSPEFYQGNNKEVLK